MKITIECTGRDNEALAHMDDEELVAWLLTKARNNRPGARIRDENGNKVASVNVEPDWPEEA